MNDPQTGGSHGKLTTKILSHARWRGCIAARGARAAAAHIIAAFRRGMRDLGYVEGANVAFAFRFADGQVARLPAHGGGI
jgi:hypothetical protein